MIDCIRRLLDKLTPYCDQCPTIKIHLDDATEVIIDLRATNKKLQDQVQSLNLELTEVRAELIKSVNRNRTYLDRIQDIYNIAQRRE